MPLVIDKLENVREAHGKTIARCPACAAVGQDNTGNHLVIYDDGKYGCVVNPGDSEHRQQIFQLVGVCDNEIPLRKLPPLPKRKSDKPRVIRKIKLFNVARQRRQLPSSPENANTDEQEQTRQIRQIRQRRQKTTYSQNTQSEEQKEIRQRRQFPTYSESNNNEEGSLIRQRRHFSIENHIFSTNNSNTKELPVPENKEVQNWRLCRIQHKNSEEVKNCRLCRIQPDNQPISDACEEFDGNVTTEVDPSGHIPTHFINVIGSWGALRNDPTWKNNAQLKAWYQKQEELKRSEFQRIRDGLANGQITHLQGWEQKLLTEGITESLPSNTRWKAQTPDTSEAWVEIAKEILLRDFAQEPADKSTIDSLKIGLRSLRDNNAVEALARLEDVKPVRWGKRDLQAGYLLPRTLRSKNLAHC